MINNSNLWVKWGNPGIGFANGDITFGWFIIRNGSCVVSRYLPASLSNNLQHHSSTFLLILGSHKESLYQHTVYHRIELFEGFRSRWEVRFQELLIILSWNRLISKVGSNQSALSPLGYWFHWWWNFHLQPLQWYLTVCGWILSYFCNLHERHKVHNLWTQGYEFGQCSHFWNSCQSRTLSGIRLLIVSSGRVLGQSLSTNLPCDHCGMWWKVSNINSANTAMAPPQVGDSMGVSTSTNPSDSNWFLKVDMALALFLTISKDDLLVMKSRGRFLNLASGSFKLSYSGNIHRQGARIIMSEASSQRMES